MLVMRTEWILTVFPLPLDLSDGGIHRFAVISQIDKIVNEIDESPWSKTGTSIL